MSLHMLPWQGVCLPPVGRLHCEPLPLHRRDISRNASAELDINPVGLMTGDPLFGP